MDELLKSLQSATREELIAKLAHALGENGTLKLTLEDAKGTRTWCQSRLDKFMMGEWRNESRKDA